jgi:hypothetical protein
MKRMRRTGYVAQLADMNNIFVGNPEEVGYLGRLDTFGWIILKLILKKRV